MYLLLFIVRPSNRTVVALESLCGNIVKARRVANLYFTDLFDEEQSNLS